MAEGDAAAGKRVFNKCVSCHSLDQGVHKVGPSLFNIYLSKAGATEKYAYSKGVEAAAAKGLTWTDAALDKYLIDPKLFLEEIAGTKPLANKMLFKLPKPDERADVIAYLKSLKK
ncbi:MAG: cytochrome c family protein [Alphaproteobacteria bacterium]